MSELLNTENLVELHEELNDFAKYHQNKGGQKAHILIKEMWDDSKKHPRDGSKDALTHDQGFDKAFDCILKALHQRFVP